MILDFETVQLLWVQLDAALGELKRQLWVTLVVEFVTANWHPMGEAYSFCYLVHCPRHGPVARHEGRAEVRKPSLHRHGGIAFFLVSGDIGALIALAKFASIFVDKQPKMCKGWRVPAKGFIQSQVLGCRDEPFLVPSQHVNLGQVLSWQTNLSANNVGDLHQVVVDDVG